MEFMKVYMKNTQMDFAAMENPAGQENSSQVDSHRNTMKIS